MAEKLPINQNKYILTKSIIEEKREQWLADHCQDMSKKRLRERDLTRDETLEMFYDQQQMNRELWIRL